MSLNWLNLQDTTHHIHGLDIEHSTEDVEYTFAARGVRREYKQVRSSPTREEGRPLTIDKDGRCARIVNTATNDKCSVILLKTFKKRKN